MAIRDVLRIFGQGRIPGVVRVQNNVFLSMGRDTRDTTCTADRRGTMRWRMGSGSGDTLDFCSDITGSGTYLWTQVLTQAFSRVNATLFRIFDNTDSTKQVAFDVSGVTTATTRTLAVPDASGTIALTSHTFTIVGTNSTTWDPGTINAGTAANTDLTVTGAAVGDYAVCSHTGTVSHPNAIVMLTPFVDATNNVHVVIRNFGLVNGSWGSGTLECTVFQP